MSMLIFDNAKPLHYFLPSRSCGRRTRLTLLVASLGVVWPAGAQQSGATTTPSSSLLHNSESPSPFFGGLLGTDRPNFNPFTSAFSSLANAFGGSLRNSAGSFGSLFPPQQPFAAPPFDDDKLPSGQFPDPTDLTYDKSIVDQLDRFDSDNKNLGLPLLAGSIFETPPLGPIDGDSSILGSLDLPSSSSAPTPPIGSPDISAVPYSEVEKVLGHFGSLLQQQAQPITDFLGVSQPRLISPLSLLTRGISGALSSFPSEVNFWKGFDKKGTAESYPPSSAVGDADAPKISSFPNVVTPSPATSDSDAVNFSREILFVSLDAGDNILSNVEGDRFAADSQSSVSPSLPILQPLSQVPTASPFSLPNFSFPILVSPVLPTFPPLVFPTFPPLVFPTVDPQDIMVDWKKVVGGVTALINRTADIFDGGAPADFGGFRDLIPGLGAAVPISGLSGGSGAGSLFERLGEGMFDRLVPGLGEKGNSKDDGSQGTGNSSPNKSACQGSSCPLYVFRDSNTDPVFGQGASPQDSFSDKTVKTISVILFDHFSNTLGHDWCASGSSDAMTMGLARMLKSEISFVVNNALAAQSGKPSLEWDNKQRDWALKVPQKNQTNEALEGEQTKDKDSKSTLIPLDQVTVDASAVAQFVGFYANRQDCRNCTTDDDINLWASFPDKLPKNSLITPTLAGLFSTVFEKESLAKKLAALSELSCRLADAEFISELYGISNNAADYFCSLEDLIGALLICGEGEPTVDCTEGQDYSTTVEDFPDLPCKVSSSSYYHEKYRAGKKSGRASPTSIGFADQNLKMPLVLRNYVADYYEGIQSKTADLPVLIPREIATEDVVGESLTYLALYRSLMIISAFSRKPYLCGADRLDTPTLIPGWDLELMISMKQPGDPVFHGPGVKRDAIPFAFVSAGPVSSSPCAIVLGFRGTASEMEWAKDFVYWANPLPWEAQVPTAVEGTNTRVLAHTGFADVVVGVLPAIDEYISSFTEERMCSCENLQVIVTGHSLGAATGQLVSLYLAEKYGLPGCGAKISSVLFGVPRALNEAGAMRVAQIVNQRIVLDRADPLTYMPCYSGNSRFGFPRCPKGHIVRPGHGRDYYADNFGIIRTDIDYQSQVGGTTIDSVLGEIFPSAVANEPSSLSQIISGFLSTISPKLMNVPSASGLVAAHVCSYACAFSTQCNGDGGLSGYGDPGLNFSWWCTDCPMLVS